METFQLKKIITLNGQLVLKTGLRIGAGNSEMHIGGVDQVVVRHPYTNEPIIPGSSIKGKIRALLEQASGVMLKTQGKPLDSSSLAYDTKKDYILGILKLFGMGGGDVDLEKHPGPARLTFSDARLSKGFLEKAEKNRWLLTEVKSENSIDRIKGTAESPRQIERVPADAIFDFEIKCKIFEDNDTKLLTKYLLPGLKLLEADYLGGMGSRGYGRVAILWDDKCEIDSKNIKEIYGSTSIEQLYN
jgi:CRISPR-associated protein Csm3